MGKDFFENKDCEYYPCHAGLSEINCLFCYCPLYFLEYCGGNPIYLDKSGIKDCSLCTFPHKRKNYIDVITILMEQMTFNLPNKKKTFKHKVYEFFMKLKYRWKN